MAVMATPRRCGRGRARVACLVVGVLDTLRQFLGTLRGRWFGQWGRRKERRTLTGSSPEWRPWSGRSCDLIGRPRDSARARLGEAAARRKLNCACRFDSAGAWSTLAARANPRSGPAAPRVRSSPPVFAIPGTQGDPPCAPSPGSGCPSSVRCPSAPSSPSRVGACRQAELPRWVRRDPGRIRHLWRRR
ncbi:MAG: hypothetical protein QOF33_280 [Thermomicrobiales bacterium]|nr:hypothetical protein [Thermomicrobiales bacterium]